jgi:metallophosphoesterase superfamily enzyme
MGSNKLKLLAISDTHLGEETSLLSFPRGLQQLWRILSRATPATR